MVLSVHRRGKKHIKGIAHAPLNRMPSWVECTLYYILAVYKNMKCHLEQSTSDPGVATEQVY